MSGHPADDGAAPHGGPTLPADLFSGRWARAWCSELNASAAYREAAASWEGAIAFTLEADAAVGVDETRRVFLDLDGGYCRGGRAADDGDLAAAASVTYNMIVEGVLAETGYHAYYAILTRHGLMPGMQQAVGYLKSDEARHLAYGVYLLSRLVAEHGEPVWAAIEARMGDLLAPAIGVIPEVFACYEEMPFGLVLEDFTDFATTQFQRRIRRIERARGQDLAAVLRGGDDEEDEAE